MRTTAIIHLDLFLNNFRAIQARIGPGRRICVPVKADAYGHGALQIAETSLKAGAFCLGAATAAEGAELRKGGITAPILLLSQPHLQEIPEIIAAGLTPFVSDASLADALASYAKAAKIKQPVQIKIDTGMGRIGCPAEEALALAKRIASCANLQLTGIATHFSAADSAAAQDIDYTKAQLARFEEAVGSIRGAGIDPGIVHAANSGAVILHPDTWLGMVRPGILLYGYKIPEAETPNTAMAPLQIQPVMELKSAVVFIKRVKKGEAVSYGRTWTAGQDTNLAVLPVGYGDGLPRLASGKWQAVIGGKTYPLVGRICMDQCLADIGPQPDARLWDEAVIFGGAAPDAGELARRIGTIPYEVTCNINKRVPRVYVGQV